MEDDELRLRVIEDKPGFEKDIDLSKTIKYLVFSNWKKSLVDASLLEQLVRDIKRKESIEVVRIDWGSRFTNLKLLSVFPNIHRLFLSSENITDLSGIEDLPKLKELSIEIDSNKRTIDALARTNLSVLSLKVKKNEDINVLSKCFSIMSLYLEKSFEFDLSLLSNLKLERLTLINTKHRELIGIDSLKNLKKFCLFKCLSLSKITKKNLSLRELEINSCGKLNWNNVSCFENLTSLNINTTLRFPNLDWILSLKSLKDLVLAANFKEYRIEDFRPIYSSNTLEDVYLYVSNKQLREIERIGRKITFRNGRIKIKNGNEEKVII